jgi:hypothetical protein
LVLQPPTLSVNRTVTLPNGTGTLALTSDISYPVSSVFGRTGAVVATNGDYTTAQVTEVTNLYFTDSRARLALSGSTGISYNNTTGVITNSAPDQVVALTASTGISVTGTYPNFTITNTSPSSGGTVTSVAALTIGTSGTDLSSSVANSTTTPVITLNVPTASATNRGALASADFTTFNNKQGTITLTTTGTSGAATFSANTLNIPNYGSALSGYLPLTGGTLTGILNINLSSGTAMNVAGNAIFRGDTGVGTPRQLIITSGGSTPVYLEAKGYGANYQTDFGIKTFNSVGTAFEVFYADSSGRVGINQVSPSYQLDVNGTGRFSSSVDATVANLSSGLKVTGSSLTSGTGAEIVYSSGKGLFLTFNRATSTYLPTEIDGSTVTLSISGTPKLSIASTGAATFSSSVSVNTTNAVSTFEIGAAESDGTGSTNAVRIQSKTGASNQQLIIGINQTGTYSFLQSSQASVGYKSLALNPNGGNVGIGTSSPSATLDVQTSSGVGSSTASGLARFITAGTTTAISVGQSNQTRRLDIGSYYISTTNEELNLATNSAQPMLFITNTIEKMRITSGGNVCIGVTTPYGSNLLNVNGGIYATSSIAAVVASDIDMFVFQNTGASYTKAAIVASIAATGGTGSYFFYGQQSTSTVALKIFSNGNIQNTNNSYGAISDARLKENIIDATPKLDDLMKVKVRNYNLKGESNKQLGVISQELEAIFPNMIEESTNIGSDVKIKGVKYSVFVPMLIKAVQELKAEIEILKNK